ncbi:MAG: DUF924 family protein [Betaproteobacteria bacterium]
MSTPAEVLDYWFGAPGAPEHGSTRALWFTKSAQTDAEIRMRFGTAVEAALAGGLREWAATPRGALALIVLLDQFTRNIHRDTPRAFAGDAQALALARQLVANGADRILTPHERGYLYQPVEHSESLADQHDALPLFAALEAEAPLGALEWARKHYEVIERFGRYPHRNATLGRESTPEEIEFLKQPGSSF